MKPAAPSPSLALVLGILLALAPAPASSSTRSRALENLPGREPVTVLVEGKARLYYPLDHAPGLDLSLSGPGLLKIVSRAEVPRGREGALSYRIWIEENGRRVLEQAAESAPAKRASIAGGATLPCKSRSFTWAIPPGLHRVRLLGEVSGSAGTRPATPGASSPRILARLLVGEGSSRDVPMISLTPVDASRSVTLAEGERLIPYYTIVAGRPVRVRVVGPTAVELTSRLDFDSTMRGEQSYRVQIWEAGRRLREFDFRTTKASTASYTDLRDRIASKMSRVTLPVGEGTHDLVVQLAQPRNGSAEIHVRIPQPEAGADE